MKLAACVRCIAARVFILPLLPLGVPVIEDLPLAPSPLCFSVSTHWICLCFRIYKYLFAVCVLRVCCFVSSCVLRRCVLVLVLVLSSSLRRCLMSTLATCTCMHAPLPGLRWRDTDMCAIELIHIHLARHGRTRAGYQETELRCIPLGYTAMQTNSFQWLSHQIHILALGY